MNGRAPKQNSRLLSSDAKTTKYMDMFEEALVAREGKSTLDDPFLYHYGTQDYATAPCVKLPGTNPIRAEVLKLNSSLGVRASLKLSDRNLLCIAGNGAGEFAVGGADHCVHVVNVSKTGDIKRGRKLYTKSSGHTDWVTTVSYTADGHIVSGGMDSRLWIWDGVQGKVLDGHVGSISRVIHVRTDFLISSSYDRSVKIWSLSSKKLLSSFHGHTGAVLDVIYTASRNIVTCGRDGTVRVWDPQYGKATTILKDHKDHVTHIMEFPDESLVSAARDGLMKVWDPRAPRPTNSISISADGAAITNLSLLPRDASIAVSASDSTVAIIDKRTSTKRMQWRGDHSHSIYSLASASDDSLVTGGGEGTLTRRSSSGELLEKISVDKNAIRGISSHHLGGFVTITDDGNIHLI